MKMILLSLELKIFCSASLIAMGLISTVACAEPSEFPYAQLDLSKIHSCHGSAWHINAYFPKNQKLSTSKDLTKRIQRAGPNLRNEDYRFKLLGPAFERDGGMTLIFMSSAIDRSSLINGSHRFHVLSMFVRHEMLGFRDEDIFLSGGTGIRSLDLARRHVCFGGSEGEAPEFCCYF